MRYRQSRAAFPARAGINRPPPRRQPSRPGVPRPRGDQPQSLTDRCPPLWRSPPARGSTGTFGGTIELVGAFPARAGINREDRGARDLRSRVPRPRGDQPRCAWRWVSASWRSPPARGSTAAGAGRRAGAGAFPARAGINRSFLTWDNLLPSVPRPRGDQPAMEKARQIGIRRSPPARGSTDAAEFRRLAESAFPARAGINRISTPRSVGPSGVPRPRGDQPPACITRARSAVRSPPARGSTGEAVAATTGQSAFPARAGINRRLP